MSQHDHSKVEKAPTWYSFDTWGLYTLILLVVLVPIIVIPSLSYPFAFTKMLLAGLLVLLGTIFVAVNVLRTRAITISKSPVLWALWFLVFAYVMSFLLSSSGQSGFLGERIVSDSVAFIGIGALLATLAATVVTSKTRALAVFLALLIPALILALFFGLRLIFGAEFLSLGVFTALETNLLGSLTDLSVFYGLIATVALLGITQLRLQGMYAAVLPLILAFSLLMLMIANITLLWWLLGVVSLGTFAASVYNGTIGAPKSDTKQAGQVPGMIASLLVLGIAASFLFSGPGLTGMVSSWFNVGEQTIRPSWDATRHIALQTFRESPVFGSGPSTYAKQWAKHRPDSINNTIVWATDFSTGVGYVPTTVTTTGLIGLLAWLLLLIAVGVSFVRTLFQNIAFDSLSLFLYLTSFVGFAYLALLAILTPVNVVILLLLFLFAGLFVATSGFLIQEKRPWHLDFVQNPRPGFLVVLALTIINLACVIGGFQLLTRYAAAVHIQKASVAIASGNLNEAQTQATEAVSMYESANYYRLLALINQEQLSELVVAAQDPSQEDRDRFQDLLNRAISSAERAAEIDPKDYQTWLFLARVYAAVVPLGIEGASDNAYRAYDKATELRPNSAFIAFEKAQLAMVQEKVEDAQRYIDEALSIRPAYADALFLESQLRIRAGELPEAIQSVEQAVVLSPNNVALMFQLGLLYYSSQRYEEATAVLERALVLQPEYANAKYFLGLSYFRQGNTQRAISEFEGVLALNPGNSDVETILTNLRAGDDPFPGVVPPQDVLEEDGVPISDSEDSADEEVVQE